MAYAAKKLSAEEIAALSPKEQKSMVIESAPWLVHQYALITQDLKELIKKRNSLKAWFKFSGKKQLDGKDNEYVTISTRKVTSIDMVLAKKYINPKLLKKCLVTKEEVVLRLHKGAEEAE